MLLRTVSLNWLLSARSARRRILDTALYNSDRIYVLLSADTGNRKLTTVRGTERGWHSLSTIQRNHHQPSMFNATVVVMQGWVDGLAA